MSTPCSPRLTEDMGEVTLLRLRITGLSNQKSPFLRKLNIITSITILHLKNQYIDRLDLSKGIQEIQKICLLVTHRN